MANFPNSSLEEVVHESFQLVDKDRLLVLFNQEVSEDVARVREYKAKACGLKVAMRRREEYIGELKALGDCEDVVETVRFMEQIQLYDVEKYTHSLLMMKATEVLFKGFWVMLVSVSPMTSEMVLDLQVVVVVMLYPKGFMFGSKGLVKFKAACVLGLLPLMTEGRRLDYAYGEVISSFGLSRTTSKTRLGAFKLSGDALSCYMERFTRLASFVGATAGDAQRQARHFKWGLKKWVLDRIVNTDYTNVAQVAAAARNIELLHESGNSNKRDRDGNRIQNRGQGQQENKSRYDQGQHEYRGRQDQSVEHRGRQDRGYDSKRQDFRGQDQRFAGRNGNDRQGQGNYNQRQHRSQSTRDFNQGHASGSAGQRRSTETLPPPPLCTTCGMHSYGEMRQSMPADFARLPPTTGRVYATTRDQAAKTSEEVVCKFSMCEFVVTASRFLGQLYLQTASLLDPSKVDAITKWRRPTTVRNDEKFLGRAGYYRCFVEGFFPICFTSYQLIAFGCLSYVSSSGGYWASMRIESNLMLQIKEAQRDDGELWAIVQNVEDGKHTEFSVDDDGVVWFEDRLCVPNDQALREKVMTEAHSSQYYSSRSEFDVSFLEKAYRSLGLGTRLKLVQHLSSNRNGQSERTIQNLEDMLRACALGDKNVRALICWIEVGESLIEGPELIEITNEKVAVAKEKLKEARSRQKSYADKHRRDLEFQVGDHVFLKVSPFRGVKRFGIKGKLSPRFIGPFEILERIGEVSYRLALPPQLSHVHDVFHVSLLRGYHYHPLHVASYPFDQIQPDMSLSEEPESILDRQERVMRNKVIPFVKILWKNHPEREATWETEESMRASFRTRGSDFEFMWLFSLIIALLRIRYLKLWSCVGCFRDMGAECDITLEILDIMEDTVSVEDYRRMSRQLKESVKRRSGYIDALKAHPSGVDSVEKLRFMKRMRLEDMEKGIRLLLMMKETEMKIGVTIRIFTSF
ncbi:putative nucleotidyltransferase, ribonuclease H [Tanacetum coccineum]